MHSLLKSTVVGAGLLVGVAATAYAQSVAVLPPASPATAPAATTAPAVSSSKIYPDPGTNGAWKEEHYKGAQSDNAPGQHPYTMPHFGPAPN